MKNIPNIQKERRQQLPMSKRKASFTSNSANKRPRLTPAQKKEVDLQVSRILNKKTDFKITTVRDVAPTGVPNTGYMLDLIVNLTRGDSGNQFEGMRVFPKSFQMRYQVEAADEDNYIRCIVFQWFDSSVPGATSILDGSFVGSTLAPLAVRSWTNKPLYKILHDEIFQLQNNAQKTAGLGPLHVNHVHISGKRMRPIEFTTSGDDPIKGGLYCLFISDSAAITHPELRFGSELVFSD